MANLTVKFAGIELKNPIVATAGMPTIKLSGMQKCIEAGVGAVTTKSITFDPKMMAFPRPANCFLDKYGSPGSVMTAEAGFWPPGKGVENVKQIKPMAEKENVKVIANIDCGEFKDEELKDLGKKLEDAGADMIEAAPPCPGLMPPEAKRFWYEERKNLPKIIELLKSAVGIPVYPKAGNDVLTPEAIRIVREAGAAGLHCVPDALGTTIDIETGRPITPIVKLNYGRNARPMGSYVSTEIRKVTNLPLLSSGGVSTARDAVERIMCGVDLVGICSIIMYRGYKVIGGILKGMDDFMERKGYKSIEDIRGIAVNHVNNYLEFPEFMGQRMVAKEAMKTIINSEKCNSCGKCSVCTYGAITMEADFPKVDLELCERCGVCQSICPTEAIAIR